MDALVQEMRARKAAWRESGSDSDYDAYLQASDRLDRARATEALEVYPIGSSLTTTIHSLSGSVVTTGTVEGFRRGSYYVRTDAHGVVCIERSKVAQVA